MGLYNHSGYNTNNGWFVVFRHPSENDGVKVNGQDDIPYIILYV